MYAKSNKPFYDFFKRASDIVASGILLILASPVLLLIALALKLETPNGPIFYSSKRVGRNYHVFSFLKFRSMKPNADQLLKKMQHLNQYDDSKVEQKPVEEVAYSGVMLFSDEGWIPEDKLLAEAKKAEEKPFMKISNDPRITKVGHFIRNTSLDELPQLINVLRGDMSLVGNRPLPLYEAEQLTTDEAVERFSAPAGITGLWQVTDRGKKGVSADSRKLLDVEYARRYSFGLDLWILFKTPVAALQSANV
ncbi:MAG: sugar transferase [Bacteroidetes bacterium]|nr:sugar transferase [Bacteroidota bacterium]